MKNISKWLMSVAVIGSFNLHAQDKKISLADALSIAKANNKGLKVEMLEEKAAKEEINYAKGAMLPSVTASGGYSYYFDKQVIFMPGAFTGNETEPVVDVAVGGKNAFNTYVTLQQPIVSESARMQIKGARINESIKILDVREHSANLVISVSETYYRALLINESINLNKQSLIRNQRSLQDSKLLLAQGKSLKVDTLRNFIVVENLKTTISYLENQSNVLMLQLKQLLGYSKDESLVLTDSLKHDAESKYLPNVDFFHTDAIQARPDIQIKKLAIEQSKNTLAQSRAQRLPTLSFVGAYQVQAQADDRHFSTYNWPKTSFVGIQASIPIFSGNRVNSRIRQSNIQLQAASFALEDATERANTEIVSLQNNLKEVLQRLSVQQRTVEAAEMNYRIVNDRYKNGLSSRLEISDAELALTEAKMNQLNVVYNIKMAKLALDKALGHL